MRWINIELSWRWNILHTMFTKGIFTTIWTQGYVVSVYRGMRQGQLAFHSLRVGGVVNVASVAAAANQLNCGLVLVSLPS